MARGPTLAGLAADLAAGRTSARALVEACLERIEEPAGQGAVAFTLVDREGARAVADAMDRLRAAGAAPSPFAGIPISIKDLFEVQGQPTRAGSRVLGDRLGARDAPAVARLRQAGFVVIGRTNMTEFAFSGLGLNPHYGTPLAPWNRAEGRIAGGSTSGGAVSVADGMAHGALGTDTGGSCRIPAAWCGLVGFKPTQRRVPRAGAVPLSTTLDSIGPIARSVACCAALDALLSGEERAVAPVPLRRLRLLAPTNGVLDGMEEAVERAFAAALARLRAAGAAIDEVPLAPLDSLPAINAKGGFAAAEAYAWHRALLAEAGDRYDPRVRVRVERGAGQSAVDYIELLAARTRLIAEVEAAFAGYDALVMPTTPILPPRLADLAEDEAYGRVNLLALRNPTTVNMFDGCAISVPTHAPEEPPVGLMLAGAAGSDARLLGIAQVVEELLSA